LLTLSFFIFSNSVSAATYYVAGDTGLDTNDGSISTPWKTIQKAADTMVAGDTANVKGGVVYSTISPCFIYQAVVCLKASGSSGNQITFQAWAGTGIPEIDGSNNAYGFTFNFVTASNYTTIKGFKIKDTKSAIYVAGNNILVTNNIIYDTLLSSTFGIFGIVGGISSESDSIYIYNNLVYQKYVGIHIDKGVGVIKNNVIINGTYGIESNSGMYVYLDIDYNNSYNNSSSNYYVGILQRPGHDLSVDPKFADVSTYNFNLLESSPLIDSGIQLNNVTNDIIENARPLGLGYDIGPYETAFSNSNQLNNIPISYYSAPTNLMIQLCQLE